MGLTLQISTIYHYLTTLLHRYMSQPPTYVPGLFSGSEYRVETRMWHELLRDNADSCKLVGVNFCKTQGEKLHEFLVLYFSHPTPTVTAQAAVVVDRAVKDRSQSSAIALPSVPFQKTIEALDRVHVVGQGDTLKRYLSQEAYSPYDTLCVLRYTPSGELGLSGTDPPSALQISTLLRVVTDHRPNYNLYEYNCYWYAGTIFEACKNLFPGYREECNNHGDRGKCRLNLSMFATHSLPAICKEYNIEWEKVLRQRRSHLDLGQMEHMEHMLEVERSARVAAQAARLESERRLEDLERRYMQLQDEVETIRRTPQHRDASMSDG